MAKRRGVSYQKRVADINRIYDTCVKSGISNREIWRRFVYPRYAISERTFYNLLNASCDPRKELPREATLFLDFDYDGDERRDEQDGSEHPA